MAFGIPIDMRKTHFQPRISLLAASLILSACSAPNSALEDEAVSYPSPPDPPRVQFLRSLSSGSEIEPGRSSLDAMLFGDQKEGEKPIVKPTAITVSEGMIYICDSQVGGVYRIDLKGSKLDLIRPKGRGGLQQPTGIYIDPLPEVPEDAAQGGDPENPPAAREIFISDRGRRQVTVYDLKWNLLRELGPWADDSSPQDLEATKDKIYIADSRGSCVRVVDRKTGKQLYTLGDGKERATELKAPTSLSLDAEGNVFVVDTIRSRIQVWNKDGEFLRSIGGGGDAPGFFGRPKAIKISDPTIWVIDSAFENCQILDFNGRPLMFFAEGGNGPGQLYLPRAIWIGSEGLDLFKDYIDEDFVAEKLIIIANQYGSRKLNFYAFGKSKKFQYPDTPLPERPSKAKPTAGNETGR